MSQLSFPDLEQKSGAFSEFVEIWEITETWKIHGVYELHMLAHNHVM